MKPWVKRSITKSQKSQLQTLSHFITVRSPPHMSSVTSYWS